MSQEDGGNDPLLRAIGEFRQELVEWIDVQLGSLRESASEAESSFEPFTSRTAPSTSTRSGRLEATDSPGAAAERLVSRDGGMVAAPKRESIMSSGSGTDARLPRPGAGGDHAGPTDARGRLDALARQLGERLRAVEGEREPSEHADRLAPDHDISEKAH
jgi:hypothetical protein